jgi:hypothetical protein
VWKSATHLPPLPEQMIGADLQELTTRISASDVLKQAA